MAAAIILLAIVAIVGIGVHLYLRSWIRDESRAEAHLDDPHTHTVAYAVPTGVDPALIKVALTRAGFNAGTGRVGAKECLRIECERQQRDQLRHVIEAVHMTAYDGSALRIDHVVFEDER